MPFYDYRCLACDEVFTEMRSISSRHDPFYCPNCHSEASRVITAPNVLGMDSGSKKAYETNERNKHEPQTLSQYKAKHGPGCGCCSSSKGKSQKVAKTGDKLKTGGTRPWMISH